MIRIGLAVALLLAAETASAKWSWNLGYHNPPGATLGLNFMNLGQNWAFEVGIGGVQQSRGVDANGNESKANSVLGDVNVKYLFSSGVVRPYLMAGAGSSASIVQADSTTASAGVGGGYWGGGLFLIGHPFYVYLGAVASSGRGDAQFGVGFDF